MSEQDSERGSERRIRWPNAVARCLDALLPNNGRKVPQHSGAGGLFAPDPESVLPTYGPAPCLSRFGDSINTSFRWRTPRF